MKGLIRRERSTVDTPTLPGLDPVPVFRPRGSAGGSPPRRAPSRRPAGGLPASPGDHAGHPDGPTDEPTEPFRVEVRRSTKRKRTVGSRFADGVLHITIPSWMSKAEEAHWVDQMTARHRRRRSTDRIDLRARSTELARRYDLPRPREIRWAGDLASRWGSCTPSTGTIRLSSRLSTFPTWVLDYVIVHELAHLEVPGHGPAFWRLVHRYAKAERAIGYLIAKSGDSSEPGGSDDEGTDDDFEPGM